MFLVVILLLPLFQARSLNNLLTIKYIVFFTLKTEQVKDENGNIITPAAVGASLGIVFVVTMAVVVIVCRRCV